jgi:hypothetical protein
MGHAFTTSLLALGLAAAGAGCTLMVNRSATQCTTSDDCAPFIAGGVCVRGACESPTGTEGIDAGTDASGVLGPPGCFTGTPATDVQFYNRCTNADHLAFDNCARIGLCNGATYDPTSLIAPPAVDAGAATTTPATLPTVGCYDAPARPKVIFMQGSTNFTGFIQAMAPIVAQRGYTIVWQPVRGRGRGRL